MPGFPASEKILLHSSTSTLETSHRIPPSGQSNQIKAGTLTQYFLFCTFNDILGNRVSLGFDQDRAHPILITIGSLRGTGGVRQARPEVRGVALVHGVTRSVALDRGSIRAKRALLASFSKR